MVDNRLRACAVWFPPVRYNRFMKPQIAEFPNHPFPPIPQPQTPQQPHVQPPTVFVYERQQWEYRVLLTKAADEPSLSEEELNALGREGWELVSVLPAQATVRFVFKRVKA